ncbi:MAG: acyl-CoA desaturase [Betaproteobacteria bacterium]|nr:acyl-CoA desaturase [Betaproteobacteria bacterium]NCA23193.1 acyl-CoA desaturase [Betaproteobacteria bacterium]
MNTIHKFRLLHVVNHIVSITAIVLAIQSQEYFWFLIGFLCFLWTGIIGVNVSLHRFYAHNSFKTSRLGEGILLISSILTSLGSPAMWCSIHRLHHSKSDKDGDPHNPVHGSLKTWLGFWKPIKIPKRFIKPFLNSPTKIFIHNNYFLINWFILGLLLIIDMKLAGFVYALPAIGCFHGAQSIGVLPHKWGYRTYDTPDQSRNNWLASILALGEGWHNNHHAYPGRWYQGERWWEFDPPAFMIKHFFRIKNGI